MRRVCLGVTTPYCEPFTVFVSGPARPESDGTSQLPRTTCAPPKKKKDNTIVEAVWKSCAQYVKRVRTKIFFAPFPSVANVKVACGRHLRVSFRLTHSHSTIEFGVSYPLN